ncbi:immunity 50 family protein [Xanthomonas prunicola]|uniref:immunity 50 family protein n=1 Tax=Xanthomonas prunicola TaxID=2053930 RepID=UPI0021B499EB|nr:immunity 50 family protein [Xanthomonas prunicola]UXA51395.1 immunity 50 family protein [Xanthomonas prunicola]
MILHADIVESIFGYWPDFADAKIVSVTYERPDSVRLTVDYIDAGAGKAAVVSLWFTGVTDLELTDLLSENVLDILGISHGAPIVVTLEACHGLQGRFHCSAVAVTAVVPNNSFKPTPLRGSA